MRRCLGITRSLNRCGRVGEWALFCAEHKRQPIVWLSFLVFSVLAALASIDSAWFGWGRSNSNPVSAPPPMPDVGLTFHRPESPQFRVRNLSDDLVREPKYQFLVYDLDLPGTDQPYLNLRIPVALLQDYVRPKSSLGPWGLTSLSKRGSQVQPGHRLFGYAQVQCPNCVEFRHYWLFFEVGSSGWFSEIPASEHPLILRRLARVIHGSGSPVGTIDEMIPVESRLAVQ